MSYIGTNKVGKMYLGSTAIGKAYLGEDLVYSSAGDTPVVLPYDAEIEYLQSTGTQYIEIPFGFSPSDEVYMNFSVDTSMGADKYMVAPKTWNNNRNRFGMGVHTANKVYTCAFGDLNTSNTTLSPSTANDGNIHQWQYKNRRFDVLDLNVGRTLTNAFGGDTTNLKLFYGYNAGTKGKITYYKHVKGGVTVIELIPVRVGQVGYMYDKVSGELFGNNGSGSFTLGNDK